MEDDRSFNAKPHQDFGHLAGHRAVGHAERLVLRARGIAERPEHVEHGAQAELTPRYAGKSKRRMEDRGEQEPDASLVDAARDAFWSEIDFHAQLLEHVGRAA